MPTFEREPNNHIYYELAGDERGIKVVLIPGFAGTMRMFDELVAHLASQTIEGTDTSKYSILSFDNRGSGRSTAPPCKQSTTMLAQDTLALLKHLQWVVPAHTYPKNLIHVYGASMGGFIAQELAILLIHEQHLGSLYLAVTARKHGAIRLPFGMGLWKTMYSAVNLEKKSPEELAELMLPRCYTPEYLNSSAPEDESSSSSSPDAVSDEGAASGALEKPSSSRTMKDVLTEKLAREMNTHLCWNLETLASQTCACNTHYLNDAKCAILKNSKVPIVVHVATKDLSMPTKRQLKLAADLDVEPVLFEGGHLLTPDLLPRFYETLERNIQRGIRLAREIELSVEEAYPN